MEMEPPASKGWLARIRSPRGASAVEFALIAPLFFMIVFGMISGAIAFNQKNELTHAAREGARFGATLHPAATITPCTSGVQGKCWANQIIDVAVDRTVNILNPATSGHGVCVALVTGNPPTLITGYTNYRETRKTGIPDAEMPTSGPCFQEPGLGTTNPGQRVQVMVRRPGELNAILFTRQLVLGSRATARLERPV